MASPKVRSVKLNRQTMISSPEILERIDCNSCGSKTYRKCHESKETSPVSKTSFTNSRPNMEVYLRLQPNDNEKRIQEASDTYVVLKPTTLLVNAPFRCKPGNSNIPKCEIKAKSFKFTKIFSPETSEVDFFKECIEPKLDDFLLGKETTIIAHGTCNPGKKYTLHGTESCHGVIKRSLYYIFDVLNRENSSHSIISKRGQEIPSENINITKAKLSKYDYYIYISCAVIYKEKLYDLLDKRDRDKIASLRLVTDKDGRTYIKDLKTIRVKNIQAACTAFELAKQRTCLTTSIFNYSHSRGHIIFTIQLEQCRMDILEKEVSILKFYDLAGPYHNVVYQGIPFTSQTETNHINNSLLVLGRCLKTIANGLSAKQNFDQMFRRVAPFRECILTRLLQQPLMQTSAVFVMHIDPRRLNSSETQVIFDLSVTLRKIMKLTSTVEVTSGTFWNSPVTCNSFTLPFPEQTPEKSGSIDSLECRTLEEENEQKIVEIQKVPLLESQASNTEPCYVADKNEFVLYEDFKVLREENDILRKELNALKEDAVCREFDVRKELVNHYSKVIEELEVSWKKRAQEIEDEGQDLLKWSVNHVEAFYKERIDSLLQKKKRKRSETYDIFEESRTIYEELEAENAEITSKVVVLKETVKKLKNENESISAEKNQCNFELALVKEALKDFQQLAINFMSKTIPNFEIDENNPKQVASRFKESVENRWREIESWYYAKSAAYKNEMRKAIVKVRQAVDELETTKKTLEGTMQDLKELKQFTFQKSISTILQNVHAMECKEHDSKTFEEVQEEYETMLKTAPNPDCEDCDPNFVFASSEEYYTDVDKRVLQTQTHVDVEPPSDSKRKVSAKKMPLEFSENDQRNSLDNTGSIDHSAFGSRGGSLKEDSGIGIEVEQDMSRRSTSLSESIKLQETEEKCTQTCFLDEKREEVLENKVDDLRDIVSELKTQYFEESERVEDLSKELNSVKQSMKHSVDVLNYVDHPGLLNPKTACDSEILKYSGGLKTVECQTDNFEKAVHVWSNGLVRETNDDIFNKSQLSTLQIEFERLSKKCIAEHIPKIATLEKELQEKHLEDVSRINKMYDKLSQLTTCLENCCTKSDDLKKQLQNHLEMKMASKSELVGLTSVIQGIANKIGSIEMLCEVTNNLCGNSYELQQNISQRVSELSSLPGNDIKPLEKDICELDSQVGAVEKSSKIASNIFQDKNQEIDRLSTEIWIRDNQLQRFIENRGATMSKYIVLVKQLQSELEYKKEQLFKLEQIFLPDSKQFSVGRPSCKGYSCAKRSDTGNFSVNVTRENPQPLSNVSSARNYETDNETDSDISVEDKGSRTCSMSLKMSGWIKVKRIGGETELVRNAQKQRDNKYYSESESEEFNHYAVSPGID